MRSTIQFKLKLNPTGQWLKKSCSPTLTKKMIEAAVKIACDQDHAEARKLLSTISKKAAMKCFEMEEAHQMHQMQCRRSFAVV